MPARGGLRLTGAWKRWTKLIDPQDFERRLRRNIRQATIKNGLLVVREIRQGIKNRDYEPNAFLTLAAKAPKDKPLVDSGDLFKAITKVVLDDFRVFVGVKKTAKGKEGEALVNIGAALHEGYTVRVTPAMRAAVFARIHGNQQGRAIIKADPPAGPAAKVWVIPPRPFIEAVLERKDIQERVRRNWSRAVERALVGK